MLGAVAGDIIGSRHEEKLRPKPGFTLFTHRSKITDDTVCTAAVAQALVRCRDGNPDFEGHLRSLCRAWPAAGYGPTFAGWVHGFVPSGYGSFANGSVMRVAPCAWLAANDETALELARRSATPTHGHPDAIEAAQAVTLAIRRLRRGDNPVSLCDLAERFTLGVIPSRRDLERGLPYSLKAKATAKEGLACVVAAEGFEDAVRLAVQAGGDTDTRAAVAGAAAEAAWGVPAEIEGETRARLPAPLAKILDEAYATTPLSELSPAPESSYAGPQRFPHGRMAIFNLVVRPAIALKARFIGP